MNETISGFLLTQVINYGAPLFALILFLGALGLPVGASFTVIAMGAFVQQGYFSWSEMSFLGLAGAALGDALSFGIGYYVKGWAQKQLGNSPTWENARASFQKNAGLAIYLTRFLITALAIPTNLVAGGSGYKFSRFIAYDITGEITWIAIYSGLGYWFGSEWETINQVITDFGGFLFGAAILGAGIWLARNWLINTQNAAE